MAATIYYDDDGDLGVLEGSSVAVVGYGNQGRSWALNLRDSGFDVRVCVRADETREKAESDGFTPLELEDASDVDVVCVLIPDDVIPSLPIKRKSDGLTIVASGYTLAFDRFDPDGDVGMIAPRMLGPEVRSCYEEGIGFITAVGVHRDVTGKAQARTLALAKAIGGLKQGAIELTPHQEAVLDLAEEQVRSAVMTHVGNAYVSALVEMGIPLEAIITEMTLSGESERTMRLIREIGYSGQFRFHSPTSQYGQLTRREAFKEFDVAPKMKEMLEYIASGDFANEWDGERDAGYPNLERLREQHAGEATAAFEKDIRSKLGPGVLEQHP